MSIKLTAADAKDSLTSHVVAKGVDVYTKYGPRIGWDEVLLILQDKACVRYACELVFDASRLYSGEMAHAAPKGTRPEDGFVLSIHPFFKTNPVAATYVALYQLVVVNYGVFASADDAELFGAAALGITRDEYYHALCQLSDQLAASGGD